MAARLLRIKAQLLLPRSGEAEAWEDPRAELVRRLLEYQQIREVVEHLDAMGEDRRSRFARGSVSPRRSRPSACRRSPWRSASCCRR
jgi:segregation and condensation protein A